LKHNYQLKEITKMEIPIQNGTFYLLDAGKDKRLCDTESNAIQALKQVTAADKAMDPEKISIMEINTTGAKWEIKSVPWSKIAIGLIREG
jgi:hypothetical protein